MLAISVQCPFRSIFSLAFSYRCREIGKMIADASAILVEDQIVFEVDSGTIIDVESDLGLPQTVQATVSRCYCGTLLCWHCFVSCRYMCLSHSLCVFNAMQRLQACNALCCHNAPCCNCFQTEQWTFVVLSKKQLSDENPPAADEEYVQSLRES